MFKLCRDILPMVWALAAMPAAAYTSIKYVQPAVDANFYKPVSAPGQLLTSAWVNPFSSPTGVPMPWSHLKSDTHLRLAVLVPPGVSVATGYINSYFFSEQLFGASYLDAPYCPNTSRPAGKPVCSYPGVDTGSDYLYKGDLPAYRVFNNWIYPQGSISPVVNERARYVYVNVYNPAGYEFVFGQFDVMMMVADPAAYLSWLKKRPWSVVFDGTPGQSSDGVDSATTPVNPTNPATWTPTLASIDSRNPRAVEIKGFKVPLAPAHANMPTSLFVFATIGNTFYFLTRQGWLIPTAHTKPFELSYNQATTSAYSANILPTPTDLSGFRNLDLFIGYGIDNTGTDALTEMQRSKRAIKLLHLD
ncbi:hypothetical protein [Parachitinimonas caeni]|uniref:DUF1329 domain-containing protein n=1 Tax=Parachitinimonas caeni TaxID=3031301 RepID=A0ABT7DT78_9NEIS|nr:hypothetical protein [Parachitinimonas caeni]MDK2123273.1 hypothetical protein [Parachitinimonas caeni]